MTAKVLVVEDDKDISRNLKRLLESEGYAVELAGNGQEALSSLLAATHMPSLIVLDLMMPVMDGFKFREEQEKVPKFAQIPVIIMTADGRLDEKRLKVGAVAALMKPVDIDIILKTVKQFC